MDINGKVAVVTGGASGIGQAVTRRACSPVRSPAASPATTISILPASREAGRMAGSCAAMSRRPCLPRRRQPRLRWLLG